MPRKLLSSVGGVISIGNNWSEEIRMARQIVPYRRHENPADLSAVAEAGEETDGRGLHRRYKGLGDVQGQGTEEPPW